jgi:WhiB family redox-sensing transcriptional regulator
MAVEWIDRARCREVGTELFFPEASDPVTVLRAKRICGSCEVQAECLQYGLRETHGIWGGTTEAERRQIRKRQKVSA